jgi:hypothetical protein
VKAEPFVHTVVYGSLSDCLNSDHDVGDWLLSHQTVWSGVKGTPLWLAQAADFGGLFS